MWCCKAKYSSVVIRILALFVLLTCNVVAKAGDGFSGTWQSRLQFMQQDLRMVMVLSKDSSGKWQGKFQSPDQSKKWFEADEVSIKDDSIWIDVSEISISFAGALVRDSGIVRGKLAVQRLKFPMTFRFGEADDLLYERPQKPLPPYPYSVEEVVIENKKEGFKLAGTLTKPREGKKFPAVILITGSGPEDRNESVFGHKPFMLLADHLTRNGFAVLRCDDRGVGASGGDYASATTDDFAQDVQAQFDYLAQRKDIDRKQIGLLGHSEGGIIAPYVAAQNKRVAFMVLLAAPIIDLYDLLLAQDSLVAKASGSKRKEIDELIRTNERLFGILRSFPDTNESQRRIVEYLDSTGASDGVIEYTLKQLCTPWMRWYANYRPQETFVKSDCPVLALYGSKDIQVPVAVNKPTMDSLLVLRKDEYSRCENLEGLNHLFQPCKTCSVSEYVTLTTTMDPRVLAEISRWMLALHP